QLYWITQINLIKYLNNIWIFFQIIIQFRYFHLQVIFFISIYVFKCVYWHDYILKITNSIATISEFLIRISSYSTDSTSVDFLNDIYSLSPSSISFFISSIIL